MKNFTLILIVFALTLTGCSSSENYEQAISETISTENNISILKRKACEDWAVESKKTEASMSLSVAILFQQIAEQDDRYTELSRAAFYMVTMGRSQNLLNELKPKWFESFAEVYRHCTSNEFLSFDPNVTPSP